MTFFLEMFSVGHAGKTVFVSIRRESYGRTFVQHTALPRKSWKYALGGF